MGIDTPALVRAGDVVEAKILTTSLVVRVTTTGGLHVLAEEPDVVPPDNDDDMIWAARDEHRLLVRLGGYPRTVYASIEARRSGAIAVGNETRSVRVVMSRQQRPRSRRPKVLRRGERFNLTLPCEIVPIPAGLRPARHPCVTWRRLALVTTCFAAVVELEAVFPGTYAAPSPRHKNATPCASSARDVRSVVIRRTGAVVVAE